MDLDDVSLGAVDDDRIDRLVATTSFDRDEAEAIVRFSKVDVDDRDPSLIRLFVSTDTPEGDGPSVEDGLTADDCDDIRREMGAASRPKTVIDAYPSKHPSVIFRHATGRCDHSGDEAPVTSPRIERDECREMRVDFQTGDTVEDVRANFNRSANAVVKHVFGRCDHTFDHDRSGRELAESVCRRMRRAYRENSTTTIADVAAAFMVGTSTAHRHLTGDCGHGDDVEAPAPSNGAARIDDGECDLLRAAYGTGATTGDLADAFDRDVTAVRKHLFGRCRHDGSGFGPDRDTVSASVCAQIRNEYRWRGSESVTSLIDRLNTSKGTFFYHLKGKCSHDHGVDPVDPDDYQV